MGVWDTLFDRGRQTASRFDEERRRLLPAYHDDEILSSSPSKEVTKVCLRLKYQIEQVIPCELDPSEITRPNGSVVTKDVIKTAKEAGGTEYRGAVIFGLLVCKKWFHHQGQVELWDTSLHECRALACEVIAKQLIETEEDEDWLMKEALLKRYSIYRKGQDSVAANVIERAVDMHALGVIGSSGYQKCIRYLWRGWVCQDDLDPSRFVEYQDKVNTSYWAHLNPDRMRVPMYQNALLVFFSFLYLGLYTVAINSVNPEGDIDVAEGILYTMTLSYICDEISKFWKVGRFYFTFWNAFNLTLYTLLAVSFVLRMVALAHSPDADDEKRRYFNQLSYNFLAFTAPMFWMRLMLFLDTFRFFGAMLVVLKVMMKESIIFFALLFFVVVGFLQGFVGMDQTDFGVPITSKIIKSMANSVMQSPDFEAFEDFAPPFGLILYYLFNFVVLLILLNILIALYNSSYEDISGNADDEYMALFAQRTLQFVRAPDENVFIPPFNLIEIIFLILPFEWWMPSHRYERLNHYIMGIIYSPLLLITAAIETRDARRIRWNRRRGEADDNVDHEWEELAAEVNMDLPGLTSASSPSATPHTDDAVTGSVPPEEQEWIRLVEETKPNVGVSAAVAEIQVLKEQVRVLTEMVKALQEEKERKDSATE